MNILTSRRLRVGQRLGLSFLLLVLVIVAVCATAAWQGMLVQHVSKTSLPQTQSALLLASAMNSEIQRQEIAIRNTGLSTDPVEMTAQAKLARASFKRASELLDKLKAEVGDPRDKVLIDKLAAIHVSSGKLAEQALSLAVAFQADETMRIIKERIQPISIQRTQLVDQLLQHKEQSANTIIESIREDVHLGVQIIVAAGIAGILFASVCARMVTQSIVRPLRHIVNAADSLAGGDLTTRLDTTGKDEISALARALDTMSDSLRGLISSVKVSAHQTLLASSEIESGHRDLSARTEQQAASLQESVATVASLTQAVEQNAESAQIARAVAGEASEIAARGHQRVSLVATTMEQIAASSQQISDIVSVIDGIAFQTNILALNAAVEAARAGDQGRGFAVVASEVRALSRRSGDAAKEIRGLIAGNAERVSELAAMVQEAASTMSDIVGSSSRVNSLVTGISEVSRTQAGDLGAVHAAIGRLDDMTQRNAALVEQATAAASSLVQQTEVLTQAVDSFKVEQPSSAELAPSGA